MSRIQHLRNKHAPSTGTNSRGLLLAFAALLVALTIGVSANATVTGNKADDTSSGHQQKKAKVIRINVSAAQAARSARDQYGGKVLGVMLESDTKSPYYRVTLLSSGQVRVVRVNAHKK